MADFPYDKSSLLSDLFFGWIFTSIRYYSKNPPNDSNIFTIPSKVSYEVQLKSLKSIWKSQLKSNEPNLLKALIKITYKEYILSVVLLLFSICMNLAQAVIINYLIQFLSDPSTPASDGALLTFAYCIVSVGSLLCKMNSMIRTAFLSGKLKSIVAIIVSESALHLNYPTVSEQSNRGKIINVVNSDIEAFEMFYYTLFLFCAPFVISIAVIIIVTMFGPVGVLGIGISVAHMPFGFIIGKVSMKYRIASSKLGDTRIKMIENLIEGIKIMKLYAWELPFLKMIFRKREEQVKEQSKITNFNGITQMFSVTGILLSIFSTLCVDVYLGYTLKLGEVFLLLNICYTTNLNIVYFTSIGINSFFMLKTAIKRAEAVLLFKTHSLDIVEPIDKYVISLECVHFSWYEEDTSKITKYYGDRLETAEIHPMTQSSIYKNCLTNLNVRVQEGEVVMIVGPVACGKTSLLMGILGELHIFSGSVGVRGKLAYAAEEPWLISSSIKENILMGKDIDQDLYTATINSCLLIEDLKLFPNGDETFVGDRGITLSGGQKARVGMARAVYSQADIVLLDDPLSAVDPEVANDIFNKCVKGQLKGKTVLISTHQIQFLSKADKILVLNSGNIVFFGTYEELQEDQSANILLGDVQFRTEKSKTIDDTEHKIESEEANEKLEIEPEKTSHTGVSLKNYWRYPKYGFKSLWFLGLFFIFLCFSQICYLSVMYWASLWSKEPTHALQDTSYYYKGYSTLLLLAYAVIAIRVYIPINLYLSSNIHLHNEALQGIALTPSAYFDKNPTGRIINRFSKDISQADSTLQFYLYEFMSSTMLLAGNMTAIFTIDPYIIAVFPIWVLLVFLLLKYISPMIFVFKKIELVSRGPLVSVLTSILNGLPTIRCLHIQKKFKQEQCSHIEHNFRAYMTFNLFMRFNQLDSDLSSAFICLANVIFIVSTKGYLAPHLAAFSLFLSTSLLGLTTIWSRHTLELSSNMSAAQRLLEFTELPTEGIYTTPENHQITKGHIKFDSVYMRYRPEFPFALSGLSFEIMAGEKIGIVGRTGAGKSSVLQVLFRLVNPEKGTVYLDNFDYLKMGIHDIRQQMSVIPQTAVLFTGTIRDNLDPLRLYSDKEILDSLDDVKLKDLIMEEGLGLDSQIKGEGISLSAGQKQLLCLARAILRKNKIIMMDEATANVDNETDKLIQKTVKRKFIGCTLLVIAHRIRTIIKSDGIIVVEGGQCKEFGTPRQLYNTTGSLFRTMVESTGPEESTFLSRKINRIY